MSKASTPRAVIHKRILDVARDQPNASIERIAGEVSGATPDLVDRVLDDYGDPAEADAEAVGDADDPEFSVEELTDRQCEILQTIYENPDASQRTLAGYLGITAPTVSRHLNKIPNWDWDRRLEFGRVVVEHVESNGRGAEETDADELDADEPDGDEVGSAGPDGDEPDSQETETAEPGASDSDTDDPDGEEATDEEAEADGPEASDVRATEEETDARATKEETGARATEEASVAGIDRRTIDRLDERIEGLERRLDGGEEPRLVLDDPELVQRVIHVCMDADAIDEDDELRIIEALLT